MMNILSFALTFLGNTNKIMRLNALPLIGFALALLGGCALPRVEVPSSSSMIGVRPEGDKITIKGYKISGEEKPHEIKPDIRFLAGTSRGILFPKQAREYLTEDLKNYIQARFRTTPDSDVFLQFNLEQAYSYFTFKSSGLNVVPFVGVVTSIADGFQQTPITFIVEVELEAKGESIKSEKVSAFITKTDSVTGWSATIDKHREIYNAQIALVRKDLFEQLDNQLLSLWKSGTYVGKSSRNPKREAAILASEIARLDSALADGRISKTEHADLVKSAQIRLEVENR